jgi:hypothetical protein
MRDPHGFGRCRDRPGIYERDILTDAGQGDVSAEWLSVERDLATRELGTDALPKGEQRRSAGSDPEPDDTGLAGRRETARMIDLDIECGYAAGS